MGKASRRKKAEEATATGQAEQSLPVEWLQSGLTTTDWVFLTAIAVVALAVYGRTLCPTIFTSGAGENVTAVAGLGVPHPPGFPLYCLLGKLFTILLPVGGVAFRVNLFSSLCAAAACSMLYVLLRAIHGSGSRIPAAAASLLFAFSRTFWSQAVIAEVYSLNVLLLICVFYALIRWDRGGPFWQAALLTGLGLTVHPLQALFFPAWTYFIGRSRRRPRIPQNEWGRSLFAFAGALSLHLYPLIRSKANPVLDWGNPENLRNLLAYLTASQYRGRMFSLSFGDVLENAGKGASLLFREFTPWLILVPLIGFVLLFLRDRKLGITTLIPLIITVVYAINYNIPWEIDVYYIPAVLILSIWSASLFQFISSKRNAVSFVLPLLAGAPLLLNYHDNDRSKNRIALDYGIDLLQTCPQDSTLILSQTDAAFSVLYLTGVEKQRTDVKVWVITEGGVNTLRDGVNPDAAPVKLENFLKEHQGVYQAQKVTPEAVPGYDQIPFGVLYLLQKKGEKDLRSPVDFRNYRLEKYVAPQPSFYMDDRNRAILATYFISRGDNVFSAGKSSQAVQQYLSAEKIGWDLSEIRSQLGLRFAEQGNKSAAIAQLRESVKLADSAGVRNRLGRLLAESNRPDEARNEFLRAIELDPNLAIAHSNLGAIHGMKGEVQLAIQSLQKAVRLEPDNTMAHNNLALAYMKVGRRDDAIAEWRTSLNLDASQETVRSQLEELGIK